MFVSIAPTIRPGGTVVHPIALTNVGADGRNFAVVNFRYRNEDFRLLTPVAGHEAKHSDGINSLKEELVLNTIDSAVYLQLLWENPKLAHGRTELTQRLNTKAMSRINTRDDLTGELRLYESEGTVFPASTKGYGGAVLDSFGASFGDLSGQADTPGSKVLDRVLSRLTGKRIKGAGFNDRTIARLDRDSTSLSPKQLLKVAREALLLDTGRKS
jgi:hypothetical protein